MQRPSKGPKLPTGHDLQCFYARFVDLVQCEGILLTMSDLSLADFPYGPKFNLKCEVLVKKQNNSIAYKKASNMYILFSGNILGLEGKVDTTLANVDHLMSNSASNERKFDDLETTHLDIKSKFCILHKLQSNISINSRDKYQE